MYRPERKPVCFNEVNPCGSDNYPYGHYLTLLQGVKLIDSMYRDNLEIDHIGHEGTLFGSRPLTEEEAGFYEEDELEGLNPWVTVVAWFPPQFAERLAEKWNTKVMR